MREEEGEEKSSKKERRAGQGMKIPPLQAAGELFENAALRAWKWRAKRNTGKLLGSQEELSRVWLFISINNQVFQDCLEFGRYGVVLNI